MSIKRSRNMSTEHKAKKVGWDAAIADAKERIRALRYSIRVFQARKKAGEPWPATQN